jgi:hypothetical protein
MAAFLFCPVLSGGGEEGGWFCSCLIATSDMFCAVSLFYGWVVEGGGGGWFRVLWFNVQLKKTNNVQIDPIPMLVSAAVMNNKQKKRLVGI